MINLATLFAVNFVCVAGLACVVVVWPETGLVALPEFATPLVLDLTSVAGLVDVVVFDVTGLSVVGLVAVVVEVACFTSVGALTSVGLVAVVAVATGYLVTVSVVGLVPVEVAVTGYLVTVSFVGLVPVEGAVTGLISVSF